MDSFRQPCPDDFWCRSQKSLAFLRLLANPEPMIEDSSRSAKPLARSREDPGADSAKGPAADAPKSSADEPDTAAQPTTPGSPAHSRPRRDNAADEPNPADVAAQEALMGRQGTNLPKQKSKATRTIDLDNTWDNIMADAPTALPGGELRVRRVQPQRTVQRTFASILFLTAYRAPTCACTCATETPPPARYVSPENETCDGVVCMGVVQTVVSGLWTSLCGCVRPPLTSTPPPWWDQARKSIPASPSATKSNHTSTPLTASISLVLLVLLPPAIPHHSNNSPPSPFYTTTSHHLPPPQYSSARLPFPYGLRVISPVITGPVITL